MPTIGTTPMIVVMPGTTMIESAPSVSAGASVGSERDAGDRCRGDARCRRSSCVRRRRVPKCRPYRHAANSGRSGAPMRISSSPSGSRASPMLSVETRTVVPRKVRSHSSIASQRSSSGERFHREQWWHTTHSRPFAASNASRRRSGKCSTVSFAPRLSLQNRHVEYIR